MDDSYRERPKTATASMRSANLLSCTSLVKPSETWKPEYSKSTSWISNTSSSLLGVTGTKYSHTRWSVDLTPSSGGFLPILNVRTNGADVNKKVSKDSSTNKKTSGKITFNNEAQYVGNTATMFDLTSILPYTAYNQGALRLERQHSLPANYSLSNSVNISKLKYTHNELSNTAQSAETDSLKDLNSNDLDTSKSLDHLTDDQKWKLNVHIPGIAEKLKDNSVTTQTLLNEIEVLKQLNRPKPILRPQNTEQQSVTESPACQTSGRKSLEVSTYVLTPPSNRIRNPNPPHNPARRTGRRVRKRLSKPAAASSAEQQSNVSETSSDTQSMRSESSEPAEQAADESADSKSCDIEEKITPPPVTKSVRFHENPFFVKEYLPWESPSNSLLH